MSPDDAEAGAQGPDQPPAPAVDPDRPLALLASTGGVLGVVEGVVPTLVFLLLWVTTHALVLSVLAPLAVVVVFLAVRLARRQTPVAAIGGAVAAAASAVLAIVTGRAVQAFVPGVLINTAFLVALVASLVVRRPLIGVLAGSLTGDPASWRDDPARRRSAVALTLLWCGLFAVRLAVEVPLYLAGATEALAVARLVTGVPLYAPVLVLTLLAVRAAARERARVS